MQEGLYAVVFQTPLGHGHGVVVLRDGKVSGGDSLIYYSGTYRLDGDEFAATIRSRRHATIEGMSSVLGADDVTIDLNGSMSGDTMTVRGSTGGPGAVQFEGQLRKLDE